MYKKLISRSSHALLAHIDNKMKESQTGRVCLEEVDEHTFGRFVEFIYTGDYNPATPVERAASESSSTQEVADSANMSKVHRRRLFLALADDERVFVTDGTGGSKRLNSKNPTGNRKRKAVATIPNDTSTVEMDAGYLEMVSTPKQRKQLPPPILNHDIDTTRPLATNSITWARYTPKLDYTPLYMSHAQLYVFAEKYDISKLRNLTAARLREIVPNYFSSCPAEVVGLARYVYDNTPDRTQEVDQLRTIVTQFCAKNIDALQESTEFNSLLHDGGQFPELLMREVCRVRKAEELAAQSLFG